MKKKIVGKRLKRLGEKPLKKEIENGWRIRGKNWRKKKLLGGQRRLRGKRVNGGDSRENKN